LIKGQIETKFSVRLDSINLCDFYILNGIVYDEKGVSIELSKAKDDDISYVKLIDISESEFSHKNCESAIVIGVNQSQSVEEKEELISLIRKNLNEGLPDFVIKDFLCQECLAVIVGGIPLEMFAAKDFVNKLKANEIRYISYYKTPSPLFYGRNAKNGMIEIHLK